MISGTVGTFSERGITFSAPAGTIGTATKETIALMKRLLLILVFFLALPVLSAPNPPSPVAISADASRAENYFHGAVGVGSWNTSVEFKDILVTSNGVVLYQSDFENQGTNGFHFFGNGVWSAKDGALRQAVIAYGCCATIGDTGWANYTLTLRARKSGGVEGFLVLFNWVDDNNGTWFNVGGWKNKFSAIEQTLNGATTTLSKQAPQTIEANVWYDIKVVLSGKRIECYVNSQLVQAVTYPEPPAPPQVKTVAASSVPQPDPPVKTATKTVSLAEKALHGGIGVGAWNTSVEYKDIVVTSNSAVLYQSDFEKQGTSGWRFSNGDWSVKDGVLRQTAIKVDCHSILGDMNWANCTITLRARKTSGDEGFLVLFNCLDNKNWNSINIGGWGNKKACIQRSVNEQVAEFDTVPYSVQPNIWYDIRVVLTGSRIQAYVNSVLICTSTGSDSQLVASNPKAAPSTTLPTNPAVVPGNPTGRQALARDLLRGAIGIGTFSTSAEFKDIVVTGSNGTELFRSNFKSKDLTGWQTVGGQWSIQDEALRQSAFRMESGNQMTCSAITGDTNWTDYTLTLKARKLDGFEGFLITFHHVDDHNYSWLNLGGWVNTGSALEQTMDDMRMIPPGGRLSGSAIKPNVWYNIKIVVSGPDVECYLDSKLFLKTCAYTMVSTNAAYLGYVALADNYVFRFEANGHIFQGTLRRDKGAPPALELGSRVRVTGMTAGRATGGDALATKDPLAPDFDMLILSPNDVVFISGPVWWTWRRLLWVSVIFLVVVTTAVIWIATILRKNRLLKVAQLELQKANDELEARVEHRTADLAKANSELGWANTELGHEQALLRALLDNASDFIYFKDASSHFVRCSLSLCAKSRLEHAEMVGKTDFDLFQEEHAQSTFEDEQEIIRTGEPLIGQLEKEVHTDGRIAWVMTTKMPWRDPEGNIIGTFGISRDITSIKEAEARLEQVHQQLVDASRKAGQAEVAASVLHNVGNVLNSVNVSVGLIADRFRRKKSKNLAKAIGLLQEHQADLSDFISHDSRGTMLIPYLEGLAQHFIQEEDRMIEEIRSLEENVNHIIEIVAMQQNYGTVGAVVETVDLIDLAEGALKMQSTENLYDSVKIVREFDPVPTIMADKHEILQILVNLLQNAKRACSEQHSTDNVVIVRLQKNGNNRVRIEVCDSGIGIAPENLPRLFTQGFTTRKNGHGLGLHSAALAAKRIGGELKGFSEGIGRGARFVLEVPIEAPTN